MDAAPPDAAAPDDDAQREMTPLSEASHTGDHPPPAHLSEYCSICINSARKGGYVAFLEHHKLLAAWKIVPTSELERYWYVVSWSYRMYHQCLQVELETVELALWFKNRAPRRAEQTDEDKRMRQLLDRATADVFRCSNKRSQHREAHKGLVDRLFNMNGSYSKWYVWQNQLTGDRVNFRVVSTLAMMESRWYLGRDPGTFIFRFRRTPRLGTGLNTFMGHVDHSVDEDDFAFVGQVPRPRPQLLMRFMQIKRTLVELFISAIEFGSGRDHSKLLPELQNLLDRKMLMGDEFPTILECWIARYPADNPPGRVLRKEFTVHRIVLEAAHLLMRLNAASAGDGPFESELSTLLTLATLQSIPSLTAVFQGQLEDEAWDKLFSDNNKDVLIYNGEMNDLYDIHAFYRQPRFHTDPFNSAICFAHAGNPRVLAKLRAYKARITK